MHKKRVIPVLLLKNGVIVRSELFKYHQIIGDPTTQVKRYNNWQVDELIYIDISLQDHYDVRRNDAKIATSEKTEILGIIQEISKRCFMPLTFGGRIRTLEDIRVRLTQGADKISINTVTHDDPNFVASAAERFGSQCIVVSVDALRAADGTYEVYAGGHVPTGKDPVSWAQEVERCGAGEILLNSIDRDGTAKGYDIELIRAVAESVQIPVIALGGVGHWKHMADCLAQTDVSAVAAANKFHFSEMSYLQAKQYLQKTCSDIRKPVYDQGK